MIKKIFIFFVFSITAFGQNKEYKKTVKLFDEKKYQEVDVISDELLSEKYGKLSDEILYYTLNMSADSNNALNNYDKAIIKYKAIIEFVNKGNIELKDKSEYFNQINNKINELKNKIPLQKLEVAKTNEIPSKPLDSSPSNSDRTVTLTVTGSGKTSEEAKQNALRSAIEQAFGTFISSKTEILNDNLVKDEIVSIANGNIQKFDIISEIQIPDIGYATTLKATVSVTKLTSFVESKGIIVEFKGGLFSQNIKLQKLNEDSEVKAIENLCRVSFDILDKSFNYELKVDEPILSGNKADNYKVGFHISLKSNDNYSNFVNYFKSTLKSLSLSDEESNDYKKINKKIFYINVDGKYYFLRNVLSSKHLMNFFINSQIIANSFEVTSNLGIVKFKYEELYPFLNTTNPEDEISERNYPQLTNAKVISRYYFDQNKITLRDDGYGRISKPRHNLVGAFAYLIDKEKLNSNEIFRIDYWENSASELNHSFMGIDYDEIIFFNAQFNKVNLNFYTYFDLLDLEKINGFELKKISVWDFIQNEDKIAIKRGENYRYRYY